MLSRIAKKYLERRGHYVVMRGTIQMVLSGYFHAIKEPDGTYHVSCAYPKPGLVALNNTIIVARTQNEMGQYTVVKDE